MAEEVAGAVVRRFTYGREPLSQTQLVNSAWVTHWYGYDEPGTGSVRLLTDSTGVVSDTYDYDPYGNTVASTGTTANPRRYRSEWWDEAAGLLYLRARWYNPATGRFLTADQWEPEVPKPCCAVSGGYGPAHHLYGYTDADPVNYIDPSGKSTIGTAFRRVCAAGRCWDSTPFLC